MNPDADAPPAGASPRFIADQMLGRLARWMRILGYDTGFIPEISDAEIARLALREGRIVLTRDGGLARRMPPGRSIFIRSQDYRDQIAQVFREIGLKPDAARFFTRCPACNGEIVPAVKGSIREMVPAHVYRVREEFSRCPDCGRIFWEGSHLERALAKLREIFGDDSV